MSGPGLKKWAGEASALAHANALFASHDGIVELRAIGVEGVPGRGIVSGFFDNARDMVREASLLDGKATGVFVMLNPVNPDLLPQAKNRVQRSPQFTTSDKDILRRVWLLIDVDPVRASGTSATDEERAAAFELLRRIFEFLRELGFPAPMKGSSGNGGHLAYPINIPVEDGGLVKRVLSALALLFNTIEAEVDQKVFNSARITKFYGTVARKGDSTSDRPHRRSKLVAVPKVLEVVPRELLESVAAMAPSQDRGQAHRAVPNSDRVDVPRYMSQHGLEADREGPWQGGRCWSLRECPFSSEHNDGAYIVQFANGAVAAGCHHNSCLGKGWAELRDLQEPDRQSRQKPPSVSPVSTPSGDLENWETPQALPPSLPPVKRFDLGLLPSKLRPWVQDIVERMQCPVEFVAASVLVLLSAILGKRLTIRPKRYDDWTVVGNLWGALIGRPSTMKSPALREVFGLMRRLEREARVAFEQAKTDFLADELVAKGRHRVVTERIRKALENGDDAGAIAREHVEQEAMEPVRKRYMVNDSSVEMLGILLNESPNGITMFRDELVGWLKSMDREGQECSRAFYLESWDGLGSFTYDRVGRGTLEIDSAIVSVFGGIQPGPFAAHMRGTLKSGKGDDGLVQRLQVVVWPDVGKTWENIDRPVCSEAREVAFDVVRMLNELDPRTVGAERDDAEEAWFLRFSDEAQPVFDEWRTGLELRLRSEEEHPAVESHLGKYRSLVPSIALVTHLADGGTGPVSLAALRKALGWVDVLESHSRRVYGAVISNSVETARFITKKLKAKKLEDGFTAREVYRKGWAGLTDREAVHEGLELLCDLGWIREVREGTSGRAKSTYLINPAVAANDSADAAAVKLPSTGDGLGSDSSQVLEPKSTMPLGGTDKADKSIQSVLSVHDGDAPPTISEFPPEVTDKTDRRGGEELLSVLSVPVERDSEIEDPIAGAEAASFRDEVAPEAAEEDFVWKS